MQKRRRPPAYDPNAPQIYTGFTAWSGRAAGGRIILFVDP
jgi:hypothetical protein